MVVTAIPAVAAQVKASRLRAIAITGPKRSAAMPEVPTIAEVGVPGFESMTWYAIYAPARTPTKIIEKLYADIRTATASSASRSVAAHEGFDLQVQGPKHLAALQESDTGKWRKTIREAGITSD